MLVLFVLDARILDKTGWTRACTAAGVVLKAQKTWLSPMPVNGPFDTSMFGKNFGAVLPTATVAAPESPASMRSGSALSQLAAADHDASILAFELPWGVIWTLAMTTLLGAGWCLMTYSVTTPYCPAPPPRSAQKRSWFWTSFATRTCPAVVTTVT